MSTYDVVITAFNQGSFICEAVDSVLEQSVMPGEVIVVDVGSADVNSCCVLDELSCRQRVRVVRQANSGVSAARNRGIRESEVESEQCAALPDPAAT